MNILKKLFLTLVLLFSISGSLNAADEGQLRFGIDFGFSPVDLEAEKTAQEIANAAGSTVSVAYDTGSFVGRLFAEYGLSENLDLEFGIFSTSDATATYTLSGASASESYNADGLDFSLNFKLDDGFFGKVGMHTSTVNGSASIIIGGTSYAVTASREGSGPLFGAGWQDDDVRYSVTHYVDVGATTDYTMFSVGWLF
jgi:hypothetical protein